MSEHIPSVELVPGAIHLMGAPVRIDQRISWRSPREAGRYDFINSYLLQEGDAGLIVETGVVAHFPAIARQIDTLYPRERGPLRLVVTRNEPDCLSNVTLMARARGLEQVYAPGIINSLDYFEHLTAREMMMSYGVPHRALRPGERVPVGAMRELEALATPLKMLSTSWYYQADTCALFCSDILTDGSSDRPDGRVVDEPEDMDDLVARMKEHFDLRYDWLANSDCRPVARQLETLFGRLDVRLLLPSRGTVIRGSAAVEQRIEALLRALREVSRN